MSVVILGHRGMLGRRVLERFPDANVIEARFTGRLHDPLIAELDRIGPDWVINCIGSTHDEPDMWVTNALLPHRIRWPLIQPSTDHVWDDTEYARSKRLGETGRVIRCAIVDPDGGLLARARKSDTEGDYLRQWNGITAKTWAEVAAGVMADAYSTPLLPGSPTTTHYELQETARRLFGWDTRTIPTTERRWLAVPPNLMLPPIGEQLAAYLG